MDQRKMGEFIAQLRKDKNYSQEQLAELIPISRQAISKWEVGKSVPDCTTLVRLSEIFDVNINEILAGERKTNKKDNFDEVTLDLYKDRNKKYKTIKILVISIVLIIVSFFVYYFVNTYNAIKIYTADVSTENVEIHNSIFITTGNQFYFRLGKLEKITDENITGINLYYVDKDNNKKTLYSCTECDSYDVILFDYDGYSAHFNYKDINYILKHMKLEITYENSEEIIDLELTRVFRNNKLVFGKYNKIVSNLSNKQLTFDDIDEIVKRIKEKFKNNEDSYVCKNDNFYIQYIDNNIVLEQTSADTIENMMLNLELLTFVYEKIYDNKTVEMFWYNIDKQKCIFNTCLNYEEKSKEFLEKLNMAINGK